MLISTTFFNITALQVGVHFFRFLIFFQGGVIMTKNRKPIGLQLLEGNPNRLTKEEIKNRQEQENAIKGFTDKIEPPKYLTAAQKREFESLAGELVRLKIFNNLDVDSLARYLDSRDQYIKIVRLLRSTKPKDNFDDYAKIQRSKNLLFNECRSAAGDLGLTITSRLKLVIPQNENKKTSPMADFLKRRGQRE